MIMMTKTLDEAKAKAMQWGGYQSIWSSDTSGVSVFGDKIFIEEIKLPIKKSEPLRFPKWDEIFETGVFEQFLAPELKFSLNKYGEVDSPGRRKWEEVWDEVSRWLMDALSTRRVEAYSLQGREIYKEDLKSMIEELEGVMREGPREWLPAKHPWERPLARALQKMIESNQ